METTLNMRADISAKIMLAALSKGISRSELVVFLVKRAMDDISNPGHMGKMVQYQKRRKKVEWQTFHLTLREDEYEYFQDMRRLMKMSLSLIVAYAVGKYLNMLLKRHNTDNNRYHSYLLVKEVIENIICWKFIWGFPPNIEKYILQI